MQMVLRRSGIHALVHVLQTKAVIQYGYVFKKADQDIYVMNLSDMLCNRQPYQTSQCDVHIDRHIVGRSILMYFTDLSWGVKF